jgi:hypothetical protein
MLKYRMSFQRDNGSWSVRYFQSVDDDDAVAYALSVRPSKSCELFQSDRWIATFDGITAPAKFDASFANDNTAGAWPKRHLDNGSLATCPLLLAHEA